MPIKLVDRITMLQCASCCTFTFYLLPFTVIKLIILIGMNLSIQSISQNNLDIWVKKMMQGYNCLPKFVTFASIFSYSAQKKTLKHVP